MSAHRLDREDTSRQEAAVRRAQLALVEALGALARTANLSAKAVSVRSRLTDEQVIAASADVAVEHRLVAACEDDLLIALRDLAGARGEDL